MSLSDGFRIELDGAAKLGGKMKAIIDDIKNDYAVKAVTASVIEAESAVVRNYMGQTAGPEAGMTGTDKASDEFSEEAFKMENGATFLSERKLRVKTGRLRDSVTHKVFITPESVEGTIGTNVVYGRIHEVGGVAGRGLRSVIPARPYLLPAFLSIKNQIIKFFKDGYLDALRKRGK